MSDKEREEVSEVILAEGEVTGHYHRARGVGATLDEDVADFPNGAELTHEEHGPLSIPSGTYVRRIVKEYDHFEEEVRDVQD